MNIEVLGDKCCGCGLCSIICPSSCITMVENTEGFLYPKVNASTCSNCEVCINKCPSLGGIVNFNSNIRVYAAKSDEKEIYEKSASGGLATEIAKLMISNGGVVYGCMLDDSLNTKHIRLSHYEALDLIQGSKYTQSNIIDVFKFIKKDLEEGYEIAFFGTPCQVAAIKKQFSKNINQLLLIDLVCHGVTSDKVFHKYIQHIENKLKSKVIAYNYRDKTSNRHCRCETIYTNSEKGETKIVNSILDSPFYYGYLNNYISRKSCYDCIYKQEKRVGDITLGDFWKVERFVDGIDDDLGYSRLIVNTSKGCEVINNLTDVSMQEVKDSEMKILKVPEPGKRKIFFDSLEKGKYDWNILKPKNYILRKLYSNIPFEIRKLLYRSLKK